MSTTTWGNPDGTPLPMLGPTPAEKQARKDKLLAVMVGENPPTAAVQLATSRWPNYNTDPDHGRALTVFVQGYTAALAAAPASVTSHQNQPSELGIAMDGVAQKLGLDIFSHKLHDVYNAIDSLQDAPAEMPTRCPGEADNVCKIFGGCPTACARHMEASIMAGANEIIGKNRLLESFTKEGVFDPSAASVTSQNPYPVGKPAIDTNAFVQVIADHSSELASVCADAQDRGDELLIVWNFIANLGAAGISVVSTDWLIRCEAATRLNMAASVTSPVEGAADFSEPERLAKAATPGKRLLTTRNDNPRGLAMYTQLVRVTDTGMLGGLPAPTILMQLQFQGGGYEQRMASDGDILAHEPSAQTKADAAFLAAAGPDEVLALLAENTRLRTALTTAIEGAAHLRKQGGQR